jgi:antitoxin component YwqK of YwqJK toxin-antitoxin module
MNEKKMYVGNLKNGKRDGFGTSYHENGAIDYVGQWEDNTFHGEGTWYSDLKLYADRWEKGDFSDSPRGFFVEEKKGRFEFGELNESGSESHICYDKRPDSPKGFLSRVFEKYEGDWVDGKLNGWGTYY